MMMLYNDAENAILCIYNMYYNFITLESIDIRITKGLRDTNTNLLLK